VVGKKKTDAFMMKKFDLDDEKPKSGDRRSTSGPTRWDWFLQ
jgi:hypothetical protein